MMRCHLILACRERASRVALEACSSRGERCRPPFMSLLFLCGNLPKLSSWATNGGISNRIVPA